MNNIGREDYTNYNKGNHNIRYTEDNNVIDNKHNRIVFNSYDNYVESDHKKNINILSKLKNKKLNGHVESSRFDTASLDSIRENIKREEEDTTVPKSVFVLITIAVVFAMGLVIMLTQAENSNKQKVNNKMAKRDERINVTSQQIDDEFETFAEDEDVEQDIIETGGNEAIENNISEESNNNSNVSVVVKNEKKQKSSSNKNKVSSSNSEVQDVPRATLKPEKVDEDSEKELVKNTDDDGNFSIPYAATGVVYKSDTSYAKLLGGNGIRTFRLYSDYEKETGGISVKKKDLDGIWIFSKGKTIADVNIINRIGYTNGKAVPVFKITIKREGKIPEYIYAKEGAVIDLSDGKYKKDAEVIKELKVTKNETITRE